MTSFCWRPLALAIETAKNHEAGEEKNSKKPVNGEINGKGKREFGTMKKMMTESGKVAMVDIDNDEAKVSGVDWINEGNKKVRIRPFW